MNHEKIKQVLRAIKSLLQKDSSYHPNEVRVILALERAVARLSALSELNDHLIFKGGFVLLKQYQSPRFTRDADALAVSISKEHLCQRIQKALSTDLEDGFWYGDIKFWELTEQGEYGAYRFDCAFQIGVPDLEKIHKLSRIHIDISFSDRLPSLPNNNTMPSLLEVTEPVTWKIYPVEFIVSEKLQTLIDRGSENSRAKDIYDLIHLFPKCRNQDLLVTAIRQTFKNRKTSLPDSFAKQAGSFERTILSTGWPGMKTFKNKPDFEIAWKTLIGFLKGLDAQMDLFNQ